MPIALLGLSANPPHLGHLALSQALRTRGYHEVWWSLTPEQEFKPRNTLAPFPHRRRLAELLIKPHADWLKLSDFEANLRVQDEHFRTAEVMTALTSSHPSQSFTFIIGGDNWAHPEKGFHTWGGFREIVNLGGVLIVPRAPFTGESLLTCPAAQELAACRTTVSGAVQPGNWGLLAEDISPISSTSIRQALQQGESPQGLTPTQRDYIRHNKLYSLPKLG